MRLAVVSHKPFFATPEGPACRGGFARFVEAMAPHWDEVKVCVPIRRARRGEDGERPTAPNLRWVPLPFYEGGTPGVTKARFLMAYPRIRSRLVQSLRDVDVVHPRIPGYVGLAGLRIARRRGGLYPDGQCAHILPKCHCHHPSHLPILAAGQRHVDLPCARHALDIQRRRAEQVTGRSVLRRQLQHHR